MSIISNVSLQIHSYIGETVVGEAFKDYTGYTALLTGIPKYLYVYPNVALPGTFTGTKTLRHGSANTDISSELYEFVGGAHDSISYGNDTPDTNIVMVRFTGDTILNGTHTTSVRKKGLVIFVKGSLTINGTVTMTARGANVLGQDLSLAASQEVLSIGGSGAAGVQSALSGGNSTGNTGGGALTSGACGGGGSGGAGSATYTFGKSGNGSEGTSYSGGSGGGSAVSGSSWADNVYGGNASSNGGAGGRGQTNGTWANYYSGGGAGNPGGQGAQDNTIGKGSDGTGGLLIIYATGSITINGSGIVSSNGSNGGGDVVGSPGGGGGSGGGSVNIFYKGTYTNNGTVQANGGIGGVCSDTNRRGGAGGAGTVRSSSIIFNNTLVDGSTAGGGGGGDTVFGAPTIPDTAYDVPLGLPVIEASSATSSFVCEFKNSSNGNETGSGSLVSSQDLILVTSGETTSSFPGDWRYSNGNSIDGTDSGFSISTNLVKSIFGGSTDWSILLRVKEVHGDGGKLFGLNLYHADNSLGGFSIDIFWSFKLGTFGATLNVTSPSSGTTTKTLTPSTKPLSSPSTDMWVALWRSSKTGLCYFGWKTEAKPTKLEDFASSNIASVAFPSFISFTSILKSTSYAGVMYSGRYEASDIRGFIKSITLSSNDITNGYVDIPATDAYEGLSPLFVLESSGLTNPLGAWTDTLGSGISLMGNYGYTMHNQSIGTKGAVAKYASGMDALYFRGATGVTGTFTGMLLVLVGCMAADADLTGQMPAPNFQIRFGDNNGFDLNIYSTTQSYPTEMTYSITRADAYYSNYWYIQSGATIPIPAIKTRSMVYVVYLPANATPVPIFRYNKTQYNWPLTDSVPTVPALTNPIFSIYFAKGFGVTEFTAIPFSATPPQNILEQIENGLYYKYGLI